MVAVEGQGSRSPARVEFTLTREELCILKAEAESRHAFRRYAGRDDGWGRGLIKGEMVGPYGTIRAGAIGILVGLVGEYIASLYINRHFKDSCHVDLTKRKHGDGDCDLSPFGCPLQVKARKFDGRKNRIRIESADGRAIPLRARAYLFSEWSGQHKASLIGWETRQQIKHWGTEQAPQGHINALAADDELKPMSRLIAFLESVRGMGAA